MSTPAPDEVVRFQVGMTLATARKLADDARKDTERLRDLVAELANRVLVAERGSRPTADSMTHLRYSTLNATANNLANDLRALADRLTRNAARRRAGRARA